MQPGLTLVHGQKRWKLLSAAPTSEALGPENQAANAGEQDLILRASQGDQGAFAEIYQLHLHRVYGLSLRLTADTSEAEILAQDAFIKAWSCLASYTNRGSFGGWLSRLTINLWRDRYRFKLRQEKLHREAALHWEAARADNGSVVPLLTAMDLERSLLKLPLGARTVFVLYDVEGYKHHEIAEMLELSPGTVKSQLHRARRLLRVLLAECQGA